MALACRLLKEKQLAKVSKRLKVVRDLLIVVKPVDKESLKDVGLMDVVLLLGNQVPN